MNKYLVTWVGMASPVGVHAPDPRTAWEMFRKAHPDFTDSEGDYYVNIEDEFGEPLLEAGYNKTKQHWFCLPHPDA